MVPAGAWGVLWKGGPRSGCCQSGLAFPPFPPPTPWQEQGNKWNAERDPGLHSQIALVWERMKWKLQEEFGVKKKSRNWVSEPRARGRDAVQAAPRASPMTLVDIQADKNGMSHVVQNTAVWVPVPVGSDSPSWRTGRAGNDW